jgi:hypothetical protein
MTKSRITKQMQNRRNFVFVSLFEISLFVICISSARAATAEQVDQMLEKAKTYVYSQQKDGLWELHPAPVTREEAAANDTKVTGGQWGGETALAVYALLAAGESPQDPRLVPAIKFLMTADLKGTYALGMRAQLYTFLPPSKEVQQAAQADAERLKDAVFGGVKAKGLFDYLLEPKSRTRIDHSVSQYGVLGMWACERAGAEVDTAFWKSTEDAWIRDQIAGDGSWCYLKAPSSKYPATAAMTAAGVATLFITQDYLHSDAGINCTGNITNPHIDAGLTWLSDHFDQVFDNLNEWAPYYALYGIERVGVASGRKYLGSVDWYQRGADYLLKSQSAAKGNWSAVDHRSTSLYSTVDTCLAMLFLSRGRAPVVFNKLQYDINGKEGNWNQRPRDVANLVHWIAKQTETYLNWQIVTLKSPTNELLEAPLLYISGNRPLVFTAEEQKKLKEYCEAGGLIVGNPDCGSRDFAESFRKLGSKLFPEYEFRELPADHPIYTNEQYPRSGWKPAPLVLSIGNGVREFMMLMPNDDAARHWQLEEVGRYAPQFQLADDIFLYAVDKKNFNEKGKTFFVSPDDSIAADRTIRLARLQYKGNWDPEPGGWRRLSALLLNKSHIKLDLSVAKLGSGQLGDGKTGATVAALTGTSAIKFDTASRQEIKNFLEGGGTLIVDAAGGSSDFAASAESELQIILGSEAALELKSPLPPSAKVYHLPGGAIKEFTYRPFARGSVGMLHTPLLSEATIGKRPAVYLSRMDLSSGMVGQPTDGIVGYDPKTATDIMTNLVVSSGLGADASVAPAVK